MSKSGLHLVLDGIYVPIAVFAVPNAKQYSSETNMSTVLVQAILLEDNARLVGAFIVC